MVMSNLTRGQLELPLSTLFARMLTEQAATPGIWRDYLERQERPLTDLYRMGQLFGQVPESQTFYDYLRGRGGIAQPERSEFQRYWQDVSRSLTEPDVTQLGGNLPAVREYFGEDPNRQFQLAAAGSFGGVPRWVRPYLERSARNIFDVWLANNPTEQFLPYFTGPMGGRFFRG